MPSRQINEFSQKLSQWPDLRINRARGPADKPSALSPGLQDTLDRLKAEVKRCWLLAAKVARKAGQFNKAYNILLEAKRFDENHKPLFVERAKICWARSAKTEAIAELRKGLKDHFPEYYPEVWHHRTQAAGSGTAPQQPAQTLTGLDRETCSKAKSLLAKYVDEASNYTSEVVTSLYKEAKNFAASQVRSPTDFYFTFFL